VKFGWITVQNWSGLIPDVGALSLPTALTIESGATATDKPGGFKEVLDKQFRTRGATLLAMTDIGSPAIVSAKKVINPGDIKGLRVRAPTEGLAEFVKQLEAAPVAIPFAEVYTALQHGTIDAAVIGFQGIQSQRVYEVMKFAIVPASFTGMGMQGFAANLQWWNGLNPKDREIIAKAIREAELACRAAIIKDRAGLAEQYREKGMEVTMLTPSMPEFAAWKKATDPLLAKGASFSKEIMAPIRDAGKSA
jgi:TRAP-type C4-dicarboxylate transport system substrate-binding protein